MCLKNTLKSMLRALWSDEQGGEVLEYALIAGLIVVAAIATISSVGGRVLAVRWQSLNSSMYQFVERRASCFARLSSDRRVVPRSAPIGVAP